MSWSPPARRPTSPSTRRSSPARPTHADAADVIRTDICPIDRFRPGRSGTGYSVAGKDWVFASDAVPRPELDARRPRVLLAVLLFGVVLVGRLAGHEPAAHPPRTRSMSVRSRRSSTPVNTVGAGDRTGDRHGCAGTCTAAPAVDTSTAPAAAPVDSSTAAAATIAPVLQTVTEPVAPVVQTVGGTVAPVVETVAAPVAPVVQAVVAPVARGPGRGRAGRADRRDVTAPLAPIVQAVAAPVVPVRRRHRAAHPGGGRDRRPGRARRRGRRTRARAARTGPRTGRSGHGGRRPAPAGRRTAGPVVGPVLPPPLRSRRRSARPPCRSRRRSRPVPIPAPQRRRAGDLRAGRSRRQPGRRPNPAVVEPRPITAADVTAASSSVAHRPVGVRRRAPADRWPGPVAAAPHSPPLRGSQLPRVER